MNQIAIECKGISKHYGEGDNLVDALTNVNLEIPQGQLTLLVGPSGSGKTTLLSIIATILEPDRGQLFLLGHEVSKMSKYERALFSQKNIGIVFQSLFLIPTLTIVENAMLPLLVEGCNKRIAINKAKDILRKLHLEQRFDVSPAILSKGQQQRVAIARAVINDASIIVCDEPTSALDQAHGLEVMALLHDLAKQANKAVLVVTHDHRIFPYADRIIEMNDGKIISG